MRRRSMLLAALAGAAIAPWPSSAQAQVRSPAATTAREISWLDLVPPDWHPQERIDRKRAESLKDDDALAQELMAELREILDTAPTVDRFDGQAVRLPGYIVPLEQDASGLREFLLVPYFGACIHTPPPPANQIVHVRARRPVQGFASMSAVWVSGTLRSERHDAGDMGVSGYALALDAIRAYAPHGGGR
jgi:uncharacterized protein